MKGLLISLLLTMAITLPPTLATNKGYRSSFKPLSPPVPAYSYPPPAYAFPPAPIAPVSPSATTYRYDVRYNPYKYPYGPSAPVPAAHIQVPAAHVPVSSGYMSPYAAAYGPVEVAAASPAYWPSYPSPHAQHFFDRHYGHAHAHAHAHGHHHYH